MIINHNLPALNTYNKLGVTAGQQAKNMEKLSSGYRINRAGDDAAGLSISEKMRAQIRGLNQANRNVQDAISMIQTAEGALSEEHNILQRMRELTVQAANDTNQTVDKQALQNEIAQLTSEINRIGNTTEFNGMKLLDGSKSESSALSNRMVVKDGDVAVSYTKGVVWSGDKFEITSDGKVAGVSFDAAGATDFGWDDLDAAETNTISITKNLSTNTFDVSVQATTDSGESINISAEQMVLNGDKYVYDNHGIKFEITKAQFDKVSDGSSVAIDLVSGETTSPVDITANNIKLDNDWTKNGDPATADASVEFQDPGITVSSSDARLASATHFKLELVGDTSSAGDAEIKITFMDASGTELVKETFNPGIVLEGETFTYDANGISFKLDIGDAMGDFGAEITVDLGNKLGVETLSHGEITDRSAAFQVGANARQQILMGFNDMRASALGIVGEGSGFVDSPNVTDGNSKGFVEKSLNLVTTDRNVIGVALSKIDTAINKVSEERSKYGAIQNRLEHTAANLTTTSENMQAAESRIRDVDMAKEMMELTKNNILQQASQAMLAQAMQSPESVLQLLR